MKTKVVEVWCALVMSAVLAGCADHDFDWDTAYRESNEYNYEAEFKSIYGNIPSNQNWDFSDGQQLSKTRADITSIKIEQVSGLNFEFTSNNKTQVKVDGVNGNVYRGVSSALPEGERHTGTPAVLVAPDNGFWIYPLLTQTGATYRAYVKVGDHDPVKMFDKLYDNHDRLYCNGMKIGSSSNYANMPGLYIEAPIGTPIQVYIVRTDNTIHGTQDGSAILVNSNVRPEGSMYPSNAEVQYIGIEDWPQGDKDYNDLVLVMVGKPKVPQEVFIDEGFIFPHTSITKRYMVEDMGYSDKDSEAVKRKYTDIDFNDIVVDFEQITEHKYKVTTVNGGVPVISTTDETGWPKYTTNATVRALGGTWDFRLYVGTDEVFHKDGATQIGKTNGVINASERGPEKVDFNSAYPYFVGKPKPTLVSGIMYNTNRSTTMRGDGQFPGSEAEFRTSYICDLTADVSGWDPDANNISFVIVESDNDIHQWNMDNYFDSKGEAANGDAVTNTYKNVYSFTFPAMGACPKIAAFSTRKAWKREQVPVTKEWFSVDAYVEEEEETDPIITDTECEHCHGTHAIDCPICNGTGTVPEMVAPTWDNNIIYSIYYDGVLNNYYLSGSSLGSSSRNIIVTKNGNNYLYDLDSKKFYTNNNGSLSMTNDPVSVFAIEDNQYLKLGNRYIATQISGFSRRLTLQNGKDNDAKWVINSTNATGNTEVTAILDGMKYDSGNTVTCTHCHGYGQVACPDCCPDADLLWTADGGLEVSNNGAFIAKDDCNLPALEVGKMINFYLSLDVAAWQTPRLVVKACSWGLGIYDQSIGVQAGVNGYTGKYEVSIMLTQDIIDALNTVDQYNNPHEYLFTIQGAYATLDAITVKESE